MSKSEFAQANTERMFPDIAAPAGYIDPEFEVLFDNFAFDEVITATATKHSPWYAIPADQKWYTRYLVSEIVLDALQKSCHEYPVLSDDAKAELLNCKAALEQE